MIFQTLLSKIHDEPRYRVAAHLLFWTAELLIGWYTTLISFNIYKHFPDQAIWLLVAFNVLGLALVYYPLVYILLPFLRSRRYASAIVGMFLLLFTSALVSAWAEELAIIPCKRCMLSLQSDNKDYYTFLLTNLSNRLLMKMASLGQLIGLVFSLSLPLGIHIALMAFRQQLSAMRLAKENVELEFNFLKSQVNPHFLFNSLNNIYGLILKQENSKAAATVARLSEFMRYTLYNPAGDRTPVLKEAGVLKDYIELEQIRLNHVKVELHVDLQEQQAELPTLLLMPVVENAFKYAADEPGALIRIDLQSLAGQLFFKVTNTMDDNRQLGGEGGIGLQNLQKRLQLYYPGKHSYTVGQNENVYTVTITLRL